jgi:hypothetical protein
MTADLLVSGATGRMNGAPAARDGRRWTSAPGLAALTSETPHAQDLKAVHATNSPAHCSRPTLRACPRRRSGRAALPPTVARRRRPSPAAARRAVDLATVAAERRRRQPSRSSARAGLNMSEAPQHGASGVGCDGRRLLVSLNPARTQLNKRREPRASHLYDQETPRAGGVGHGKAKAVHEFTLTSGGQRGRVCNLLDGTRPPSRRRWRH